MEGEDGAGGRTRPGVLVHAVQPTQPRRKSSLFMKHFICCAGVTLEDGDVSPAGLRELTFAKCKLQRFAFLWVVFIEPVHKKKGKVQSNLQALMQTRLVKLLLRVITSINKNVTRRTFTTSTTSRFFFHFSSRGVETNPLGFFLPQPPPSPPAPLVQSSLIKGYAFLR